jgi:hypothetical protein
MAVNDFFDREFRQHLHERTSGKPITQRLLSAYDYEHTRLERQEDDLRQQYINVAQMLPRLMYC